MSENKKVFIPKTAEEIIKPYHHMLHAGAEPYIISAMEEYHSQFQKIVLPEESENEIQAEEYCKNEILMPEGFYRAQFRRIFLAGADYYKSRIKELNKI